LPADAPRDYQIGYKKPPVATRFKKGNRANPRGRPRGSKNLATLLERALDAAADADASETHGRLTKRELVVARLVERSAKADLAATKLLFELLRKSIRAWSPRPPTPPASCRPMTRSPRCAPSSSASPAPKGWFRRPTTGRTIRLPPTLPLSPPIRPIPLISLATQNRRRAMWFINRMDSDSHNEYAGASP
jgi:Family of unknown function (DUF5681)